MERPKEAIQLDLLGRAPEVIIDVHEVDKDKKNSITLFLEKVQQHKIPYRVEKLEVGDLILPNQYAIERKSIRDFLNSIIGNKNGKVRIFEQVKNLVETYKNPILLLEGSLSIRMDYHDKAIYIPITKKNIRGRIYSVIEERIGIHPNAYLGALNAIEEMGVRIEETYDIFHGAQILWDLYLESKGKKIEQTEHERAVIRIKPRLRSLREQQIFFLAGLPGISVSRASKILSVYKTPYNAIMKVNRWDIDVEGIGEKTLEKISKVLFSEFECGSKDEPGA
ncbi:MAG: hypothetical protein NDP13_04365 [Crenarchaeota archaeon]|nr:hypothetical protein [Thermoproteota archaeon]MCR8454719.1 hypothetical protein [Thermoproteota archaeon]